MLEQNLTINFILRKRRKHKDGKFPIYLRVTLDGDSFEKSINRSVKSKHWDEDTKRVKESSDHSQVINEFLSIVHNKVLKHIISFLLKPIM